jgi:putative flippase GtrA
MNRCAARGRRAATFDFALLVRHQAAAFAGTVVDFGMMIALVELTGAPPPIATFASALVGGFTNFLVSRMWAFRDLHDGPLHVQAARYTAVSLGGAVLNALVLAIVLYAPFAYLPARIAVSIAVSLFYTYPLHTRFVFRVTR